MSEPTSIDEMSHRKWCKTCGTELEWKAEPHSKDDCIRELRIRDTEQDEKVSDVLQGFRNYKG